jgi:DNA-binding transcriptional MerR regulator
MKMREKRFRIGQLADKIGVERFVIRFWEKEFNLKAQRSPGGQRFYGQKDYQTFAAIKKLLYEDGFTIAGAKQHLGAKAKVNVVASHKTELSTSSCDHLAVKDKLESLKRQLWHIQQIVNQ